MDKLSCSRETVYGLIAVVVFIVIIAAAVIPSTSSFIGEGESESSGYIGGGNIGYAVGGAMDVNNFRENITSDYLPLPTDITYEGLFYDYYFDTGQKEPCEYLFCPSYNYAVCNDIFSGQRDYYLAVGLNSGIKKNEFDRKKLNLVVVLDVSSSMSSCFNDYYYDQYGKGDDYSESDFGITKIQIARESVAAMLDHLGADDRFGMVIFNDSAQRLQPLRLVGDTNMGALKHRILNLHATGGTNLSAGMSLATAQYGELLGADPDKYENRIIFLTDAMPNKGVTSEYGLVRIARDNAENGLYSTFIGIGVDFNTELIEIISKMKGSNYYSTHSAKEFRERMDDSFAYMVTPLVFDLELNLNTEGWDIEKVYGSPEADESTGQLMKVNTLFPSETKGGQTRGGLVLLKLQKQDSEDNTLTLLVEYTDRNGNRERVETDVDLPETEAEFYDNMGIRKGVLLARYADLMRNWTIDERSNIESTNGWEPSIGHSTGITVPSCNVHLGRWERQSVKLRVSDGYRELFEKFREYFTSETDVIGDDTLQQEIDILNKLC